MSPSQDIPETPARGSLPSPWKATSLLAILFLVAIAAWTVLNLHSQGRRVAVGIAALPAPRSLREIGEWSTRSGAIIEGNVFGKAEAMNLRAGIESSLGKTTMNAMTVIKGPDGKLFRGGLYTLPVDNASALAVDIADFAEAAAERGARVLYLGTPDTVSKSSTELPSGMPYLDFNPAVDALLFTLRERGVPFLDSRYALEDAGVPFDRVTQNTGFLLTGDTAFTLFTLLVDTLEKRFSLRLDPDHFYRDRANYSVSERPAYFLGQLGKETGPAFGGLDDFTSFAPAFETEFAIEGLDMFGNAIDAAGPAGETLLNPNAFVYYDSLYNLYPEGYYIHTNAAWTRVVNPRNPDGPKLLVVHDFYTAQLISHLAPMFSEIHTITSRDNYQISALEYLQDKDFDCVLVSFFPQNLLSTQYRALLLGDPDSRPEPATESP